MSILNSKNCCRELSFETLKVKKSNKKQRGMRLDYLILGATGFIGSFICKDIEEQGKIWIGTSRVKSGKNIVNIDLSDPLSVDHLLQYYTENTTIINASGSNKPQDFEASFSTAFKDNYSIIENLANAVTIKKPKRVIHLSSAGTVYGESNCLRPFKEDDILKPIGWYGRAKMIEELILQSRLDILGVPLIIGRVTNPFGNSRHPSHGFIDVLLDKMKAGSTFSAYFDINASRDFIHVKDLASIILMISNSNFSGVVNIGSGSSTSLNRILECVLKFKENHSKIIVKEKYSSDVISSCVDVTKMNNIIGNYFFTTPDKYINDFLRKIYEQ